MLFFCSCCASAFNALMSSTPSPSSRCLDAAADASTFGDGVELINALGTEANQLHVKQLFDFAVAELYARIVAI